MGNISYLLNGHKLRIRAETMISYHREMLSPYKDSHLDEDQFDKGYHNGAIDALEEFLECFEDNGCVPRQDLDSVK